MERSQEGKTFIKNVSLCLKQGIMRTLGHYMYIQMLSFNKWICFLYVVCTNLKGHFETILLLMGSYVTIPTRNSFHTATFFSNNDVFSLYRWICVQICMYLSTFKKQIQQFSSLLQRVSWQEGTLHSNSDDLSAPRFSWVCRGSFKWAINDRDSLKETITIFTCPLQTYSKTW